MGQAMRMHRYDECEYLASESQARVKPRQATRAWARLSPPLARG